MLNSSSKLILAILGGALGAVLLSVNSIGASDELGESGNILIRYGAPALLLMLAFTVVRSFAEISRRPPFRTVYSELVTVLGAVAFLIGTLVWGLFYVTLVLFHPTSAL
jgi:EamA domain-containing membrane protein RarD